MKTLLFPLFTCTGQTPLAKCVLSTWSSPTYTSYCESNGTSYDLGSKQKSPLRLKKNLQELTVCPKVIRYSETRFIHLVRFNGFCYQGKIASLHKTHYTIFCTQRKQLLRSFKMQIFSRNGLTCPEEGPFAGKFYDLYLFIKQLKRAWDFF